MIIIKRPNYIGKEENTMDKNKVNQVREEITSTIQAYNDAGRRYDELHDKIGVVATKLYKSICKKEGRKCHSTSLYSFSFNEKNDCITAHYSEWYDGEPSTVDYVIPIYILTLEGSEQDKAIEELADIIVIKNKQEREFEAACRLQAKREEELAELARLKAKYEQ